MSLDGTAEIPLAEAYRHRDSPPAWDGIEPSRRWRAYRRELLLWQADTEVPPARQAVKAFRHMTGQAKLLAESVTDRELMAPNGIQILIAHFDQLYAGAMKVTAELDFDAALFTGHRQQSESFLAFAARKTIEFSRYEQGAQCRLPDQLKAKVLLRQCKASEKQMQRLLAWLDGERTEVKVREALSKLDTDLDVTLATAGHGEGRQLWQTQTSLWQADIEESWHEAEDTAEGTGGLAFAELYSPENDVGYDSEDENYIWVYLQDAESQEPLDEEELQCQLVNFAAVQKAKQAQKIARGWFAPTSWTKGNGKGKGLQLGPKGKGKGKKGEGKMRFPPSMQRDDRRRGNMTKVPVGQLTSRVRCWRCGQVGHMARNCQQLGGGTGGSWSAQPASASAGGSSNAPPSQTGGSSRGSSKGYFIGFTWTPKGREQSYLTWRANPDHASCLDTDCAGSLDLNHA
eukprot:5006759-Amphidinium_carterae.1